jgi:hypothetical protein
MVRSKPISPLLNWPSHIRFSLVIAIVALLVGCGSGETSSTVSASPPSPPTSTTPSSIDSMLAPCNSGSCAVEIPPGTFTFSKQIAPKAIISIQGAGASYDNPGIPVNQNPPGYQFVASHCLTTLIWTGGDVAPFLISTYKTQGSRLQGFCLDSKSSIPVFIDVDGAGDVRLVDVSIDTPTTKATTAGIRWGATGIDVGVLCDHVFVREVGPIGLEVLNVQGDFIGNRCRSAYNDQNDWVVGDASHFVESFHCIFCTGEAKPGNVPVLIQNVWGFSWDKSYTEGYTAFDVPAGSSAALQISITDSFASGSTPQGVSTLVHSGLSTATFTISGNFIIGATTSNIVADDALTRATIIGNTDALASVATSGQFVCSFGNTVAAPAPQKPPAAFCP